MSVKNHSGHREGRNRYRTLAVTLLLLGGALVLPACSGDGPALNVDAVETLQGNWERRGYGEAIAVNGAAVTTYHFTSSTCLVAGTESVNDLGVPEFSDDQSGFSLRDAPVAFADRYVRIESLPPSCDAPVGNTPEDIYQHLWNTFNEYYAFFAERNVDWLAQFDATRDAIRQDMSNDELFATLSTMIAPIDDQHVSLQSPAQSFDPGQPKGFLLELRQSFEAQSAVPDLESFIAEELSMWESNIQTTYLDGDLDSAGGPFGDLFTWGVIDDVVGYLRVDMMILNFEQDIDVQVEQVHRIMDTALEDLANTQALIVDVRMNPGGADPIAFAIASRFADMERSVVSKFSRSLVGQGEEQVVTLVPGDRPGYLNPVVLITSALTTSGAEVLTLAMRAMPQVTHMGENTNGALSDLLEKPLPNGWVFTLSNEVYLDADGVSHEAVGIAPQVRAPVFDRAARLAGRDSAIDAALMQLGFNAQ